MTIKPTLLSLSFALLAVGACKKGEDKASNTAATSSEPAKSGEVAKPAEAAKPAEVPPPAAAADADIDLSPAGDKWKGWAIKAPADTKVVDNGAGGATIMTGKIQFELTQGDLYIKDAKAGLTSGKNTKFTFTVDKADAIEYTSETPVGDGTVKGYGAKYYANADKKIGCSLNLFDDEKQLATAKAICNSVHAK